MVWNHMRNSLIILGIKVEAPPTAAPVQGAVYDLQAGHDPISYHDNPPADAAHQEQLTAAPTETLQHAQQRSVDRAMKEAAQASAMAAAAAGTAANITQGAEDRLDATGTFPNYTSSYFD
jgi:hypothetical protein